MNRSYASAVGSTASFSTNSGTDSKVDHLQKSNTLNYSPVPPSGSNGSGASQSYMFSGLTPQEIKVISPEHSPTGTTSTPTIIATFSFVQPPSGRK